MTLLDEDLEWSLCNRDDPLHSKALSDKNLRKSAYDKDIMALVLAIQHWRPYLLGRPFTISTYQKSLKILLDQRIPTTDQQNWITKLLGYEFSINYKPGKEHRPADALSRIPEGEFHTMISSPKWLDGNNLLEGIEMDQKLQKIIQALHKDPSSKPILPLSMVNCFTKTVWSSPLTPRGSQNC